MTPRTRTSNMDATFKVYYSKKIPKQRYFPHRRKTVRRPDPGQDEREPRQMVFLPDAMRVHNKEGVVKDSEGEDTGEEELSPMEADSSLSKTTIKAKKRDCDFMQEDEDEDEEPIRPTPKRRKRTPKQSNVPSPVIEAHAASNNDELVSQSSASPSSSAAEQEEGIKLRRRRQSTMTQLVDGRRPKPGDKEPEFRRVKRTSSGKKKRKTKGKDKQQRTLTQMVPRLLRLDPSSNEDTDDESGGDDGYNEALASHFEGHGTFQPSAEQKQGKDTTASVQQDKDGDLEADADESDQDEYQPTQITHAPATKRTRTVRRVSTRQVCDSTRAIDSRSTPRKPIKARFGLLSTPERRQIREIPSSQSPPETLLSTQSTPGSCRLPLRERFGNARIPQDTPSKRKQVTFQEGVDEITRPDLLTHKFGSTVQDSEDEDGDIENEDQRSSDGEEVYRDTGFPMGDFDQQAHDRRIGTETQAMIEQIDQACANAIDDTALKDRDSSEELGSPGYHIRSCDELQDLERPDDAGQTEDENQTDKSTYHSTQADFKQEPRYETTLSQDIESNHTVVSPPMNIKAENEEPSLTTPALSINTTQRPSPHAILDLDGEPVDVVRLPTPTHRETQETTRSHPSKAEQQLQSEWLSFSQYPHAAPTSSMHVVQDVWSYQATPFADVVARDIAPPQWSAPLSQATTVDGTQITPTTTPKKLYAFNNNMTPDRVPNSQQISSPEQPPTLVIPSSYPSPSKASYRDWSSPVLGRTQIRELGSVEDFSIPALPPMDDIDDDEDE